MILKFILIYQNPNQIVFHCVRTLISTLICIVGTIITRKYGDLNILIKWGSCSHKIRFISDEQIDIKQWR